jgi:8-oxo-dGTP pyrophosphatase MutT (NUDIX family)
MKSGILHVLLKDYIPSSEELVFKQRILTILTNYPEACFERTHFNDGHITASSWLLDKTGSKALLMHHAKLNMWVQPGGHCDGDPDVLAVALKEAQEETGINGIAPVYNTIFDVDVHALPATSREPAHFHYDIRFLLQVTSDEQFVQNHESKELRWVTKVKKLLPTQERSVVRMFEKWINR